MDPQIGSRPPQCRRLLMLQLPSNARRRIIPLTSSVAKAPQQHAFAHRFDETGLTNGAQCSAIPKSAAVTDRRSTIMAAQNCRDYLARKSSSRTSASTYIVGVDTHRDVHLGPRAQQSRTPLPPTQLFLTQHGTAHNGNETPLIADTKAERLDRYTQVKSWCHHH